MKRALSIILTILIITASMPAALLAAQSVRITIPSFTVTLNGTPIDSLNREYPLIVYKDITYFPMTYHDCRYLGLETSWSERDGLGIINSGISGAFQEQRRDKANNRNSSATICEFPVKVNNKNIDNAKEEYPLLVFRDVTYFPLTWRFAVDEFGWEYSFSESDGLKIRSSSKGALAETKTDSANSIVEKKIDNAAGIVETKNNSVPPELLGMWKIISGGLLTIYEFKPDGILTVSEPLWSRSFSYSTSGNKLTYSWLLPEISVTFDYMLYENTLRLTSKDGEVAEMTKVDTVADNSKPGSELNGYYWVGRDSYIDFVIEFKTNGKATFYAGDKVKELTYTVENDEVRMVYDGMQEPGIFKMKKENNMAFLTDKEDATVVLVKLS